MEGVVTWLPSIVVALITGLFAYLGVVRTSKLAHDQLITDVKNELKQESILREQQVNTIKSDIKRLEEKQDKHNAVIERTYKLEQKVEDLEKRI